MEGYFREDTNNYTLIQPKHKKFLKEGKLKMTEENKVTSPLPSITNYPKPEDSQMADMNNFMFDNKGIKYKIPEFDFGNGDSFLYIEKGNKPSPSSIGTTGGTEFQWDVSPSSDDTVIVKGDNISLQTGAPTESEILLKKGFTYKLYAKMFTEEEGGGTDAYQTDFRWLFSGSTYEGTLHSFGMQNTIYGKDNPVPATATVYLSGDLPLVVVADISVATPKPTHFSKGSYLSITTIGRIS